MKTPLKQLPPQLDSSQYADLLKRFSESGPFYTSYPVMAAWQKDFGHDEYVAALKDFFVREGSDVPLHLYVHIPFCAKLCWYCICNMTVSNDRAKIQQFLNYLLREIDLLRRFFDETGIKPNIREIHLGGGTPSHLDADQFAQLTSKLSTLADLDGLDEFAMEIDPRTTQRENLAFFAAQGVNRISFGVQDFDPTVQKAINRVQPFEMVDELLSPEIRKLYTGFNFDLLYGLPHQTRETLRQTLKLVERLAPERVCFYKYAHIPEVRKHMRMIKDADLPPAGELPLMCTESVQTLIEQGYVWVGIDFFSKPPDDLALAVENKTLRRTFNGYTPGRTEHMIGLGPTSAGAFGRYYSQSLFEFPDYFKAIEEGKFPVFKGYKLKTDDLIRRDIIFRLFCEQRVDFDEIDSKYGVHHQEYFDFELTKLREEFAPNGVLEFSGNTVNVTSIGRLFLRHVSRVFDTFTRDAAYQVPRPALAGNRSLM